MKLEDAVIVYVNFDSDIAFDEQGTSVFYGDYAEIEAMELVRRAIIALYDYEVEKKQDQQYISLVFHDFMKKFPLTIIAENEDLLKTFMLQGGLDSGNHEISIGIIGEKFERALLA